METHHKRDGCYRSSYQAVAEHQEQAVLEDLCILAYAIREGHDALLKYTTRRSRQLEVGT